MGVAGGRALGGASTIASSFPLNGVRVCVVRVCVALGGASTSVWPERGCGLSGVWLGKSRRAGLGFPPPRGVTGGQALGGAWVGFPPTRGCDRRASPGRGFQ